MAIIAEVGRLISIYMDMLALYLNELLANIVVVARFLVIEKEGVVWVGGELYLTKFISQHYEHIEKLLKKGKQFTLGKAGILLGARYGALDSRCDNCKIEVPSYTVVILKPIPPRYYHTIKILCTSCRELHMEEVKYYIYLNK